MPQKKLSEKFSLDRLTKKQFKLLRTSFYTIGLFVILGFITFHVLQIEAKTFKNLSLEQKGAIITIQHFSGKDHTNINLSLKLTDKEFEKIDQDDIDVRVIKTLSPLLREKGNIIAEKEELKE